jgi:uncharacterized membrane protein
LAGIPARSGNRRVAPLGLGVVLLALFLNLLLGAVHKAEPGLADGRCLAGLWGDPRALALCYTDIRLLYRTESLQTDRLPYVEPCTPREKRPCDEYPVLTMYMMWLAAVVTSSPVGFFSTSVFLLSIAAAVVAVCLYLMVGRRALYFALAPTLLLYGFMNWDLVAVALATGATLAFLSGRHRASGILIGLGAAAKGYPALLLAAFVADRLAEGDRSGAFRVGLASVVTWLTVNVPFIIAGREGWLEFFEFNARRRPDVDSLWSIGCGALRVEEGVPCDATRLVNILSVGLMAALAMFLWWIRSKRDRRWPRWTFAFPLLILFLLTNKVYSPQYSLWLLPWIALALPRFGLVPPTFLFAAFEATELAVFVTRFLWLDQPLGASSLSGFDLAILARAFMLVVFIVAWTTGSPPPVRQAKHTTTVPGATAQITSR